MTNKIFKACLLAATLVGAHSASATPITYSVSDAITQCGGSGHGLWTNQYNNSGCNEYYSFQTGSTLKVDGATAVLSATVENSIGDAAKINITFGGFAETYSNTKEGGGVDYDPSTDSTLDWDFFTYVISGSIVFSNGDTFETYLIGQDPNVAGALSEMPVLQIGKGANDKNSTFGGSTWIDVYSDGADYTGRSGHWDLNMNLSPVGGVFETVPVPGTLGLLMPGVALLGLTLRRRRSLKA